jgi:hypothetical protein
MKNLTQDSLCPGRYSSTSSGPYRLRVDFLGASYGTELGIAGSFGSAVLEIALLNYISINE